MVVLDPGDRVKVAGPVALATFVLNGIAGVAAARIHGFGRPEASNVVFTILSRGEAGAACGSSGADAIDRVDSAR